MVKRKQPSGELRTNPIPLVVGKIPVKGDGLWDIKNIQPFFPPIECLFKTESLEGVRNYGIRLNDSIVSVSGDSVTLTSGKVVNVHRKVTMLLNPYKWMKGEFGAPGLPTVSNSATAIHSKMQSPHTAGYVGSILSIALSQSSCDHFPKVFGVYTGTSEKHTIDISDDYEELSERSWFSQNIGKTFALKLDEELNTTIQYTRTARLPLEFGETVELDGIETIDAIETPEIQPGEMKQFFKEDVEESDGDDSSSVSTSYIFQIASNASSYEEEDAEEESDEPFAWATFENVPVQVTVMEKCSGTLYDLFIQFPEPEKQFAWISQIIFALAFAQRNFAFTHNDLHGNNIMYIETTKEFLYYSHAGTNYKVPTYGYLLKIIDFDRGIGSIRLPGMKEAKVFMSDQFAVNEEAGGQYNVEPFYLAKHPIIKPNPSFDLVRLATSMFWDLFPNGPKYDEYLENPVFKLFMNWLTFSDGTSVLFHKHNPKFDRYPGFYLYKAIARYSDTAVPRKEIDKLKQFIGSIPPGEIPLLIDI
jgi:hypothetical protein